MATTTHNRSSSIVSAPGVPALLASSILARLPLAMFGIELLVHAQRLTGSFAVAGLVSGAYAISRALAAPFVGRLVDRETSEKSEFHHSFLDRIDLRESG